MKITSTNIPQIPPASIQNTNEEPLETTGSRTSSYIPNDWNCQLCKPKLTLKTIQISLGSS